MRRVSPACALVCVATFLAVIVVSGAAVRWRSEHQLQEVFPGALKALSRQDLGAVNDAIAVLESNESFAVEVQLLRGALLMQSGDNEAALSFFVRVPAQGHVRQPALFLTGECLYRVGRLADAEAVFRQLSVESPDSVDAHRWLGAIYYDLGANDAAIAELQRVIDLDHDDYRPHRLIALMQKDFSYHREAIEHYRRGLALSPPADVREEMLRELAQSLIAERRYSEALDALQHVQVDAASLALLSECHWSLGELERAEQLLEQARKMDPQDRGGLFFGARMSMESGRTDAAMESLRQLVQQDPHDVEAHYQLALAYQRLGDEERHQTELARWQELNDMHQRLTQLNTEAIMDPYNADLRRELAEVCASLGKHELAIMWRSVAESIRRGPGEERSTGSAAVDVERLQGRSRPTSPD